VTEKLVLMPSGGPAIFAYERVSPNQFHSTELHAV
jgi:hypothetical protein